MGVENSYTMEASFCGSTLGSRANTHLTNKDFEDIGQTFCETLLDYYNEDPRNVCIFSYVTRTLSTVLTILVYIKYIPT